MRLFFNQFAPFAVLAAGLFALPLTATAEDSLRATPYYGAGSLGAVSVAPLADNGAYENGDDLYSRTGSGEGMHDGGNLYGTGFPDIVAPVPQTTAAFAPQAAPINIMPPDQPPGGGPAVLPPSAPTTYSDRNFTFVSAAQNVATGLPTNEPVFAPPPPPGNVQGFDNKPRGSFYDGAPRREWGTQKVAHEWNNQTRVSGLPAVKDNAYFSGLDATPQRHEPYYVIASNNADWMLMWQQHMGREPPGRLQPGQVAVASILGPRNYTGYEARVKIIGQRDNLIQVLATQATPAPQVAQERKDNAPFAILVVHAGSRGVEVVQNRALNTGNYNYADDPKIKTINWDPAEFYASPYHEKRIVVDASRTGDGSDGVIVSERRDTATVAPADPRAVPTYR